MSGPKQLANLLATSRNLNSSNVPLETILLDASGAQITSFGSGGTQYTEGDQDATITGTALLLEKPSSNQIEVAQGSTAAPAADAFGLTVRSVLPTRQSTSILVNMQTANGSTTLVSSQAGVKQKVYAYSVTSTVAGVSSCAFLSSLGTAERWGLLLGSGSSGVTGANLAVAPPGTLFETDAASPLGFTASSTGLYRVSISWFSEA